MDHMDGPLGEEKEVVYFSFFRSLRFRIFLERPVTKVYATKVYVRGLLTMSAPTCRCSEVGGLPSSIAPAIHPSQLRLSRWGITLEARGRLVGVQP